MLATPKPCCAPLLETLSPQKTQTETHLSEVINLSMMMMMAKQSLIATDDRAFVHNCHSTRDIIDVAVG